MKGLNLQDVALRFLIGGTVVALVYLLVLYVPWRSFAGVFASFPGVMATAVALAGWRHGSRAAADVAYGSVIGMIGATACVVAMLVLLPIINNWGVSLLIAIGVWFGVSLLLRGLTRRDERRTEETD